jgi:hypothetical protein
MTIGGTLDTDALSALAGTTGDRARMRHFELLSYEQKIIAIVRMHDAGYSDRQIAHACQLSVEQICRLLAEHGATRTLFAAKEGT